VCSSKLPLLRFLVLSALLGCTKRAPAGAAAVVVAAAASLRVAMPQIVQAYEASHPGRKIEVTYGASGELRQQVVGGAPVDVVAFAGAAPVDDLIARGLVDASSRKTVAFNRLVLVGPKGGKAVTFATLRDIGEKENVAIGDPRSVPAGQYAKEALEHLHEWDALQGRLVLASDVSAALAYARRGEVAAAIVYRTETRGVSEIEVKDELAEGLSTRPEVVVGIVKAAGSRLDAEDFAHFLEAKEAEAILVGSGFDPR
jgi:molybdate transport system substrate-binding protein